MSQKYRLNWIVIVCVHGHLGFQFLFFGVFWALISFLFGFLVTGWICGDLCTRKVSLRVSLRDSRECGKKRTIPSFARKHEWTNCISRHCKVSLLVVHHIAFPGLEPLSRKKSASQEDSYMKSLAGFSNTSSSWVHFALLCLDYRNVTWNNRTPLDKSNHWGIFRPEQHPQMGKVGSDISFSKRPSIQFDHADLHLPKILHQILDMLLAKDHTYPHAIIKKT